MRAEKITVRQTERTDAEILRILDLRARGKTAREIARITGNTRNAVLGLCYRVRCETAASRHDGTMPGGWWRAGLKRQEDRNV